MDSLQDFIVTVRIGSDVTIAKQVKTTNRKTAITLAVDYVRNQRGLPSNVTLLATASPLTHKGSVN